MNFILATFILFLFSAAPAKAYVDPGTASIALQALIGGIAAVSLFFRSHIATLISKFRRGVRKDDKDTRIESKHESAEPVGKDTNATPNTTEKR